MRNFLLKITLFFCIFSSSTSAQERNFEIGMNVTGVLSNILAVNAVSEGDPSILLLKYNLGKKHLRVAGNFKNPSNTEFTNNTVITNNLTEAGFRIGLEKRLKINNRFDLLYGLDFRYGYLSESSSFDDFINNSILTTILDRKKTYSVGPIVGANFTLSSRIILSIESALLLTYANQQRRIEESGTVTQDFETNKIQGTGVAPYSLYLYIRI